MLSFLKKFIVEHEPFRPAHTGNWIRGLYCRWYLPSFVKPGKQSILDAACGNGRHSVMLREIFPEATITGIDLRSFTEWEQFSDDKLSFRTGDLTDMRDDQTWDVIVSIDTLEHIPKNERVLRSFFRALRPGGYLYLAVPREDHEAYLLPRHLFSEFDKWADEEHIGEMRKLGDLVDIMREVGYEIKFKRSTFTYFGKLAWEIETVLHHRGSLGKRINFYLMPLYKLLGILDLLMPTGEGNNLVIARKTSVVV